jgi:Spy/CpxP family protein refolding chaperone
VTRTKIALLISFGLVFAAGAVVGHLAWRWRRPTHRRRSWLSEELDLTSEQREQMREIWSDAMSGLGPELGQRRRELAEERERAVEELLSPEQMQQYQRIQQEHERALHSLAEQREEAFRNAAERTKQILTPQQREKYEKMIERMRERTSRWRGRGPHRRPHRGVRRGPAPSDADGPDARD